MGQNRTPEPKHPFIVALTGGIASGKTLISEEFARLGVAIVDTDVIAHQLVKPGQPALLEIIDTFGPDIVDLNGQLNRSKLRALIFSDPTARLHLESILHPKIRQEADRIIKTVKTDYCILVIPLLTGKATYPNVSRILVVDVAPETQIERLMARDDCNREQAIQALKSQMSREDRLKIADDVLENSGLPIQALNEVARFHKVYSRLATNI